MKNLGYYNGEYGSLEEMKIPMNDRVCFFGDGVYDATSAGNHHIFLLDEHVDRFFRSAEMLRIPLPFDKEELKQELNRICICDFRYHALYADGSIFKLLGTRRTYAYS